MAEARPVTDDWVVRDIMSVLLCFLARAWIAVVGDRLRCRVDLASRLGSRERGLGALTGSVRQTGYGVSMPWIGVSVNDCGLFIEAWLIPR